MVVGEPERSGREPWRSCHLIARLQCALQGRSMQWPSQVAAGGVDPGLDLGHVGAVVQPRQLAAHGAQAAEPATRLQAIPVRNRLVGAQ